MSKLKLPAIDPATIKANIGNDYPERYGADSATCERRAMGNATGLTRFGVNITRLPPGCASAQRHWHKNEDEFVYVLEGEIELVTDSGSQTLKPGMAAGFPAGKASGHHLVNRSSRDALYLEVGDRQPDDEIEYPGIDLQLTRVKGKETFFHRDGRPWKPGEK